MRIESIRLQNFRNIRDMLFLPTPGVNVICGENAQGKTNLLEAVWLFTGARSFRGAKESEYLLFGETRAQLALTFFSQQREQTASIVFGAEKKNVEHNEIKQDGTSALAGSFGAVVFSPDHLNLIKQGPEFRRKLLDQSLCQAYPKYAKALEGYGRILRQRGNLLRDVQYRPSLLGTLDTWDEILLEYGSYITATRARYAKKLAEKAARIYEGISSGREKFDAAYQFSFEAEPETTDRAVIRQKMEHALRQSREKDIQQGVSFVGPHRDDLEILVGGKSARAFGSQGQQRSCVLALKLAECGILEESMAEPPVVLLDDVMSELDEGRRSYLLQQMEGRQVLITCCDTSAFTGTIGSEAVFRIAAGALL